MSEEKPAKFTFGTEPAAKTEGATAFQFKTGAPTSQGEPKQVPKEEEAADDSATVATNNAGDEAGENTDEGEDVIFMDKAILYRFSKPTNEWKERGMGVVKILKNRDTGRCRLLMRRKQTFKVCANHYVLPHMELKIHNGSDRTYTWAADDYADGAKSSDVLSIKFKDATVAKKFAEAFESAKKTNEALLNQQ